MAGFLVGWLLDSRVLHLWPSPSGMSSSVIDGVGGFLVGAGLALAFWGIATFTRAKTAIVPNHDASKLVTTGPYKFTRNPMYTGLTAAYVGLAAIMSTGWPLLLLPFVLMALYGLVISREERYLIAAFGDQYRAYQRDVGRWGW